MLKYDNLTYSEYFKVVCARDLSHFSLKFKDDLKIDNMIKILFVNIRNNLIEVS